MVGAIMQGNMQKMRILPSTSTSLGLGSGLSIFNPAGIANICWMSWCMGVCCRIPFSREGVYDMMRQHLLSAMGLWPVKRGSFYGHNGGCRGIHPPCITAMTRNCTVNIYFNSQLELTWLSFRAVTWAFYNGEKLLIILVCWSFNHKSFKLPDRWLLFQPGYIIFKATWNVTHSWLRGWWQKKSTAPGLICIVIATILMFRLMRTQNFMDLPIFLGWASF